MLHQRVEVTWSFFQEIWEKKLLKIEVISLKKKKDWSYFIILTVCLLNEFDKHTKCDMILFFEKQLVT